MAEMDVELVAPDRLLWTGEATFVFARTTEGEIGILPRHIPLVAELAEGEMVRIDAVGGEEIYAAVHGGFLSVTDDGVSILAELAESADEIDVARAQQALERARAAGEDDDEAAAAASRATSRLRAAGQSV